MFGSSSIVKGNASLLYPAEEPKEAMTMLADRGEEDRRNCAGRSLCVCRQTHCKLGGFDMTGMAGLPARPLLFPTL